MKAIYVSLDSDDIALLLRGKMILKLTPDGFYQINMIAKDDGVDVYRKKVMKSLEEVEAQLYR